MLNQKSEVYRAATGHWLRALRQSQGLTGTQLARQLAVHPATLRATEEANRVVPPGWCEALQRIGHEVPQVAWPSTIRPYRGIDLATDLECVAPMKHSPYGLSQKLAVPEGEVKALLGQERAVPASWLLKLAELGATVPALVRIKLYQVQEAAAREGEPGEPLLREFYGEPPVEAPAEGNAVTQASTPAAAGTSSASAPAQTEQSFRLSWSESNGLLLTASPALLQDMQLLLRTAIAEIVRSEWFAGMSLPQGPT